MNGGKIWTRFVPFMESYFFPSSQMHPVGDCNAAISEEQISLYVLSGILSPTGREFLNFWGEN